MRREIKIPLNCNLENYFNNWLNFRNKIKKHHRDRIISSIYYDDENFKTAKDNLDGISNRRKYRIRWYNFDEHFKYEIKLKRNNVGQKVSLNSENNTQNLNDLFTNKNKFFKKKENIYFNGYLEPKNLKPKLKVNYLRSYFLYKNKVRITYDKKINYELLNKPSLVKNKIYDQMNVVELKFNEENLNLAVYLIRNSKFIPKRFSKYLRGLHLFGIANYI